MSYFPPPPPAPPPALPPVPNHASDIRPSTLNGFRGGGSRGHQRRGCQAQTRYSARSHFAFPGCLSNAQRYDGGYGHNSNSRNGQRLGFKGLTDQLPESKDTVTANSSPKQPHQQPMHRGAIGPDGGSWRNAGRNPTNGEYTSSDYQQVASPIPELDANGGAATLKGHSMRIGREEQRTRIQSIKYSQNTQRDAQTGAHSLFTGFDGINGLFPSQFGPRSHSQVYGGRGRKRGYGEAFGRGRPAQSPPRGQAPPAVPSFGGPLPLPAKPAPRSGETKLDKTKKRKHNQLGLTPSTVEHDSSKDEDEDLDDQDEEIKLAAAAVNGAAAMQISYKGQTSTLQSPADIAAWIAERKRRFPTKARAAEAAEQRQQREQARRKAYLAQVERRNRQVKEPKENKRQKANEHAERRNARDAQKIRQRPEESEEAATKGKRKVEKLRRQLKKEEKRVAKAEAKAMERQRSSSPINPEEHRSRQNAARSGENSASAPDFVAPPTMASEFPTPTSQTPDLGNADQASIASDNRASISSPNPSLTDSEYLTSSSGSDSSNSGSAPDEKTSRSDRPRMTPPTREKPRMLCRFFMTKGRCRLGASCRFKHELPQRGSRTVNASAETCHAEIKKVPVSLYQRLIEQEKKNEEEAVLSAILYLGDKGALDEAVETISVL